MSEAISFRPPRRRGLMFHITFIVVLGGASALTFLSGMNQKVGTYFVLLLLISLLLFAPLPWIIYRAYSLMRASYQLERDGLRLRWGLRAEDIPLTEIEWVRRASDLAANLSIPRLSFPGAVLGMVRTADLGPVEYMASSMRTLVLIATPRRIYAISPEDPETFLHSFQRSLEMGSLLPISPVSVLPAAYLSLVWSDVAARGMLSTGFLLTLLLFVGVSLIIPGRVSTSLGFYPSGAPLPSGPASQLLLLPILGSFTFVVDLATGLFFYRRENSRLISYIVWGSSILTALLLIGAVMFIVLGAR